MSMGLLLNFFESVIGGTSDLAGILFWVGSVFIGKLDQNQRMRKAERQQGIGRFGMGHLEPSVY
jgi:hypothetical protein